MPSKIEKLKKFLYKISFKKVWSTNYQGADIHVENWWNILLISGEKFSINGKIVQNNFHWLPAVAENHTAEIEGVGHCKMLIASKWHGGFGCHILINDKIIGGDLEDKLYFLPKNSYQPKEFDSTLSPFPSLKLRSLAFMLDLFFVTLANFLIYWGVFKYLGAEADEHKRMLYTFVLQLIFNSIFFGIVQTIDEGSPGKRLLGMRLVDKNLKKLKLKAGLKRYFVHFILLATGGFGFLKLFLSKDRTGLHDEFADTIVVRKDYLEWKRYLDSNSKNIL